MYTITINLPTLKIRETTSESTHTPEKVYETCKDLAELRQESMHIITLDSKYRQIDRHMIYLGTSSAGLVSPKEIFHAAIIDNATSIIIVHNHPSGDPTPSAEDINITCNLCEAGQIMGIAVLDHIIIGRPGAGRSAGWLSLREEGLVNF